MDQSQLSERSITSSGPGGAWVLVLKFGMAALLLGTAIIGLRYEGPVFSYLFVWRGWSESNALMVERGGAWLLIVSIFGVFIRPLWPLLLAAALWLVISILVKVGDYEWHPWMLPGAHGIRYLLPIALALIALRRREDVAIFLVRLGISLTFLSHGLEAIWLKPGFVDFILIGADVTIGTVWDQSTAESILLTIGVVDVLVAVALWLPKAQRPIALWMAFWGGVTAFARIVCGGWPKYPDTLLRMVHVAAPLALFLYWTARAYAPSMPATTETPDENPSNA